MVDDDMSLGGNPSISLGISIEAEPLVQQQIEAAAARATASNFGSAIAKPLPTLTTLAQRIVKHLFNHITSYATSSLPSGAQPLGMGSSYVPLKTLEDWYNKFSVRVANDAQFLQED